MPYNSTGLVIHDADAHVMETPNWLRDHADAAVRDRIDALTYSGGNELRQTGDPNEQLRDVDEAFKRLVDRHRSTDYLDNEATEIMARKNFAATGAFIADDRGRALDLLGFASQLIFNTFHNRRLRDWEHSGDLELAVGAARAHNRAMIEFCSSDPRLLPTLYVPLADLRTCRRIGGRGDLDGRRGIARRLGLPADPLAEPRRPRRRVGSGQRRRHPGRVPRRRHR